MLMKTTSLPRPLAMWLLDSPLLFVILLLMTSALATSLYQAHASLQPPTIANYNWSEHPNTLLIAYPVANSCSTCNISVRDWANQGLRHHLDVLVIASHEAYELKQLKRALTKTHIQ